MTLVNAIDALLPQTQCEECGYKGCRPYAEALAGGNATIDRCPPGGVETLHALGALLKVDPKPFEEKVAKETRKPAKAVIREAECIGCTKCIQACPVDAIIGSAKQMHSVLEHECTGCGLCVDPCPVDCIDVIEQPSHNYDKDKARQRYRAQEVRRLHEAHEKQQIYRQKRQLTANHASQQQDKSAKQDYIKQALARAQAKKQHEQTKKTRDI